MFKRTLIAFAAFSMLATPMAQAQSRYDNHRPGVHNSQQRYHAPQRYQAQRHAPPRSQFRSGQRFGNWQRYQRIQDHRRYGLRAPARGQQWVRVGNEYLLIAAATGLIVGLAIAR